MMATQIVPQMCVGAILFTDLVGFTEFNDAVGDTAALAVLDHQTELAAGIMCERHGARIVKELGDGLMMWFASAGDGLGAATSLLSSIADARAIGTFPLAVRMGLHHGPAAMRGDDLVGQTVNIAARVAALAGPGELLISGDVIDAYVGRAQPDVTAVGPVHVKGVHEPIWLHRYSA